MNKIDQADAFEWLPEHKHLKAALVTSLPDADELSMEPDEWESWFMAAIGACFSAAGAPAVFYQTDRKANRRLYSKAAMLFEEAERFGWYPLWHKIAYRVEPGNVSLYRPAYSHLIAFSPNDKFGPGRATPDVIDRGITWHSNGAGVNAARLAMIYLISLKVPILNPFCGKGTFIVAGQSEGVDIYACDLDEECVRHATIAVEPRQATLPT